MSRTRPEPPSPSRRRFLAAVAPLPALAAAFATQGCKPAPPAPAPAPSQGPIRVTATVAMVADLVRRVGGDAVDVTGLMGPGVDPHLYKATAEDLIRLQRAELVVYNGLHLEGRMQDVFDQLRRSGRPTHALGDSLPKDRLLGAGGDGGALHDPHIWFDVELWSRCATGIGRVLGELRPASRAEIERRATATEASLRELHAWALGRARELPPESRVLVTSHDAFNYFGRAYGFQVIALQGISTVTEAGLADVAKLVDFIKARRIRAVFVESSVPHATLERISRDAGVKIGGELFSDAMGVPGQIENGYDLGTYDGMIRHNLNTIIEALR